MGFMEWVLIGFGVLFVISLLTLAYFNARATLQQASFITGEKLDED